MNEKQKEKIITLLKGHGLEPMAQKPHLWLKGTPPNTRMVDMSVSPPQVCVFDGHNRLEEGHGIQELDIIKEQIGNILNTKDEGKTDVSKPQKAAKKGSKNGKDVVEGKSVAETEVVETVVVKPTDKEEVVPEVVKTKPVKKHTCSECKAEITPEQASKSYGEFDCLMCQGCIDLRNGVIPKPSKVEVVDTTGTGIVPVNKPTGLQSTDINLQEVVTVQAIIKYICPEATTVEAYNFMQLCLGRGLNPFLKEAYLIKYKKDGVPTMVVGKDAFTRKAEESGQLDGFETGVIIQDKGKPELIERVGMMVLKDEVIIGGWAKVHRKDMIHPFEVKVSLSEYIKPGKTNKTNWDTMPATMIRKVALCQALREAFTSELGGCYDSAEMTDKYTQE